MRSGSGPCGSITTPAFQNQTSLTANKFHKYPTSYYVIIANKAQQYNVCLLMNILLVCMRLFFISWMWKIYFLKMAYIYQTVAYKNTFALQCKMLGLQSFCVQFSWVPSLQTTSHSTLCFMGPRQYTSHDGQITSLRCVNSHRKPQQGHILD